MHDSVSYHSIFYWTLKKEKKLEVKIYSLIIIKNLEKLIFMFKKKFNVANILDLYKNLNRK